MAGLILAGDIGGTKTHLGLFRTVGRELQTIREHVYQTAAFPGLEQACAAFLLPEDRIGAACFGVPGPVIDGISHATNVSWSMAQESIQRAIGGPPTHLMNDLEATAYGVPYLHESEIAILQRGEERTGRANIAVIAAGTGLGEAALIVTPSRYFAVASEGGHSDFAPRVTSKAACSSSWRASSSMSASSACCRVPVCTTSTALWCRAAGGRTRVVVCADAPRGSVGRDQRERAGRSRPALRARARDLHGDLWRRSGQPGVEISGARRGLYLRRHRAEDSAVLARGGLIEAFLDKGRLRSMLERIDIRVSLNPSAALIGAAWAAVAMQET